MNNFTTNVEYTGCNIDTLMSAGYDESNEFATFNQARKFWELSGKELKGAKACARLMTIVLKKDKEGKEKKVPKYFSVFEIEQNHFDFVDFPIPVFKFTICG